MTPIFVLGYPKSGTTWLCRLLGDALDCPIGGMLPRADAKAIATEGQDREGPYVIRQGHAVPYKGDVLVPDHNHINPELGGKVVILLRDPRDVAVSGSFYWERPLKDFIAMMGKGKWPIPHGGGWQSWYGQWKKYDASVRYEDLSVNAGLAVKNILYKLGLKAAKALPGVIERQSFAERRRIAHDGLNYGKKFQVRFLRKGIVGDWKNHFGPEEVELAEKHFQPLMGELGYK